MQNLLTNSENSIGDAHTTQPGEIVFNTMRHTKSEAVQISGVFSQQMMSVM